MFNVNLLSKKNIFFSISLSFFLIVYLALYIFKQPLFFGHAFTYLLCVFVYEIILVYLSISATSKNSDLIILSLMMFSFFNSLIYTIGMAFPFLSDPYYYFAGVLNILRTGSLNPVLASWYWLVSLLKYYPVLHIWAASNMLVIGITPSVESIRFATILVVFLNALVPLFTYTFCNNITKNINISLLASTIMSSQFVFYQYHEQYFAVLLYLILFNTISRKETNFRVLTVILLVVFSMVHRASVLILLLILSCYFLVLVLSPYKKMLLKREINILILGIVLMLTNLTIIYIGFLNGIIQNLNIFSDPFTTHLVDPIKNSISSQLLITKIYGYFSYSKYVIFLMSFIGIIFILLKNKDKTNYISYILYYIVCLSLTVCGGIILIESMNRFLLFLNLFIALFSALFFYICVTHTNNVKKVTLLIILGIFIGSNTLYCVPLQFIEPKSYVAAPPMNEFYNSGRWIYKYDSAENYIVEPNLRHIVDYFGEISYSKVTSIASKDYYSKNGSINLSPYNMSSNDHTFVISTYKNFDTNNIKSQTITYKLVYSTGKIFIMKP